MANSHYILTTDVTNWAAGATAVAKQEVVDRTEQLIEQYCGRIFYEKRFDIYRDGNRKNRMVLNLPGDILSVTSVKIYGNALDSSWFTNDKYSVHIDVEGAGVGSAGAHWLLKQSYDETLFPRGVGNINIEGTYGTPWMLNADSMSSTRFQVKETITGGTTAATAEIVDVADTYFLVANRSVTDFEDNELITGGTSGATAAVNDSNGSICGVPLAIKQAAIILCSYANDETLYTPQKFKSEKIGTYSYTIADSAPATTTGVVEADILLRPYMKRRPWLGA